MTMMNRKMILKRCMNDNPTCCPYPPGAEDLMARRRACVQPLPDSSSHKLTQVNGIPLSLLVPRRVCLCKLNRILLFVTSAFPIIIIHPSHMYRLYRVGVLLPKRRDVSSAVTSPQPLAPYAPAGILSFASQEEQIPMNDGYGEDNTPLMTLQPPSQIFSLFTMVVNCALV